MVPTRELSVQVTSVLSSLTGGGSGRRKQFPMRIRRLGAYALCFSFHYLLLFVTLSLCASDDLVRVVLLRDHVSLERYLILSSFLLRSLS